MSPGQSCSRDPHSLANPHHTRLGSLRHGRTCYVLLWSRFSGLFNEDTNQRLIRYCHSNGLQCFPMTEVGLCGFMSYLADEGLKHRSIKTYLSGVRYHQLKKGLPDPFKVASMPRVEYVMKGIKRHQAKVGTATRSRLPITPSLLRKLKEAWSPRGAKRDIKLMWAACCLLFFRFPPRWRNDRTG